MSIKHKPVTGRLITSADYQADHIDENGNAPPTFAVDGSNNIVGLAARIGTFPFNYGLLGVAQNTGINSRIKKGGVLIHPFTTGAATLMSGGSFDATGWTLADVDGSAAPISRTGNTGMVKMSCDGTQNAATGKTYGFDGPSSMNVATAGLFGFWIYLDPASTVVPTLNIGLSDNNAFAWNTHDWAFAVNSNQIRRGWNFIVLNTKATNHPFGISVNNTGADFSTAKLNRFEIYTSVTNGETAAYFFDSLWTGFQNLPGIVVGFDGTLTDDTETYIRPTFEKYGLVGYAMLSSNAAGTTARMDDFNAAFSGNPNQITNGAALYADGWDFGNHTLNHTNTSSGFAQTLTNAELQYQIEAQKAWQFAHGWTRGAEFYAAPQGQWSEAAITFIKARGIVFQRNGSQHMQSTLTPFGYDRPDCLGWQSMDAPVQGDSALIASWQKYVQIAIDYQSDMIFGFHKVVSGTAGQATQATGNNLQIYSTALDAFLAWLVAQQTAGSIKILRGLSEMYYGS